jgi:hypothetical protein
MKTKASNLLKELKQLTNTFTTQLLQTNRTIKENYEEDINNIKEDLLSKIAYDYSLNLNELKMRYLKRKKTAINDISSRIDDQSDSEYLPTVSNTKNDLFEPTLLHKVDFNNNSYYIEPMDGGKVYDVNNNEVGLWKNGIMELDNDLIKNLSLNNKSVDEKIFETVNSNLNDNKVDVIIDDSSSNVKQLTMNSIDSKNKKSNDDLSLSVKQSTINSMDLKNKKSKDDLSITIDKLIEIPPKTETPKRKKKHTVNLN